MTIISFLPKTVINCCRLYSTTAMHSIQDKAKKCAAEAAVNAHFHASVKTVGIGSGSTIEFAVARIAEMVHHRGSNVVCVPTSLQAKQLIRKHKLILSDLEETPVLDVAFDGADEFDSNKVLIKGGGACLTQEKIVASCAQKLIIITDFTKQSNHLGEKWKKGIPLEVLPMACSTVSKRIQEEFGGKAVVRPAGSSKAGPVVTDNGLIIIDWMFDDKKQYDWKKVDEQLNCIPGVLSNGLFVGMTSEIFVGEENGSVSRFS